MKEHLIDEVNTLLFYLWNVKDKTIISHFYQNEKDCDSDGNRLSKNGENGHLCIKKLKIYL